MQEGHREFSTVRERESKQEFAVARVFRPGVRSRKKKSPSEENE
jgi:hypothetical protein